MNGETSLSYIIAVVAIVWAVWLQIKEHRRLKQDADRQTHNDTLALKQSIDNLVDVLEVAKTLSRNFAEGVKTMPDLVSGMTELIKTETVKVDTLNRAVDLLHSCMAPAEDSDKYEQYAKEFSAPLKREVEDLIRRGVDPEVAEARVREKNIYEEMGRNRR